MDLSLVGSESIGIGIGPQGWPLSLLIGSLGPAPHLAITTTPGEKVLSDHDLLPSGR